MPSLQVRELPDNIYSLLQEKAKKEHRSLAQEAVVTLAKGLEVSLSLKNRRMELLKQITANPPLDQLAIDLVPADLLREDRDR